MDNKFIFLLFILLLPLTAGCSYLSRTPEPTSFSISAIYLVHGQGELDKRELQKHPEVVVTDSFDKVKQFATQKIAIWIDKNAAFELMDADKLWLKQMPQTTYPMAVVGYGEAYSFGQVLGRCCWIGGPRPDTPLPYFTVLQGREGSDTPAFMKEYTYKPHVQDILDITNVILDGTIDLAQTPALP